MPAPTAPTQLRAQGIDALKNRQFDAAAELLNRYLDAAPNDTEAELALAAARSGQGKHGAALVIFERQLEKSPHSPSLHFNRGTMLERLGRKVDAAQAYELVLRLKPDHGKARQRLRALHGTVPANVIDNVEVVDDDPLPEVEAVDESADVPDLPVEVGEGTMLLQIRRVEDDLIELSSNRLFDLLVAVATPLLVLATIAALIEMVNLMIHGAPPGRRVVVYIGGLGAFVTITLVSFAMLFRVGQRMTIDARTGLVKYSHWFGLSRSSNNADDCAVVRLKLDPPDKDGTEICTAELMDQRGDQVLPLGGGAVGVASTEFYVRLACRVANVLKLPVKVMGRPKKPHPDFAAMLQTVRDPQRNRIPQGKLDRLIRRRSGASPMLVAAWIVLAALPVVGGITYKRLPWENWYELFIGEVILGVGALGGMAGIFGLTGRSRTARINGWGFAIGGAALFVAAPIFVCIHHGGDAPGVPPVGVPQPVGLGVNAFDENARITQAVSDLRGLDQFKRQVACSHLLGFEPKDDRREAVLAALEPLLTQRGDWAIRVATIHAYAHWGTRAQLPKLRQLLNDDEFAVKSTAEDAIREIESRP
jgi:hypothetical protein